MSIYHFQPGDSPLLISFPHDGEEIPDSIRNKLNTKGQQNGDCDWHIAELYDCKDELSANYIVPRYSRYVVDLNRPADGGSLYPGKMETAICPRTDFAGKPIYLSEHEPEENEIQRRIDKFWWPYHEKLRTELKRIHSKFGFAILWEAHSIAPRVPTLFKGRLPSLNFGTANGNSCDPGLVQCVQSIAEEAGFDCVLNARFKGGYITRHYGDPIAGIHAIQLEINQDQYLKPGFPIDFEPAKAERLRQNIRHMLEQIVNVRNTESIIKF